MYHTKLAEKLAEGDVYDVDSDALLPQEAAAGDAALLEGAAAGDAALCVALVEAGECEACYQESERGRSALMLAAAGGHAGCVQLLLSAGAPWNAIDRDGRCAGNHALDAGHQAIVDLLVEHATRCELILGASERHARHGCEESEAYLRRSVVHEGERNDGEALIDENGDAVMMVRAGERRRQSATLGACTRAVFAQPPSPAAAALRPPPSPPASPHLARRSGKRL